MVHDPPPPFTILLSYCVHILTKHFVYTKSNHFFCQKLIAAKTTHFILAFYLTISCKKALHVHSCHKNIPWSLAETYTSNVVFA